MTPLPRVLGLLLGLIPTDTGSTAEEIAADARRLGLPVKEIEEGTVVGRHLLRTSLRRLRHDGMLMCDRHQDPPRYYRTPTGNRALQQAAPLV